MFKHSLYVAILVTGGLCVWVATRVGPALRAYRSYIMHTYGTQIAPFVGLFLLTLTLALLLIGRVIWLKDTGRKLQHAAKELQQGGMARSSDELLSLIQKRK